MYQSNFTGSLCISVAMVTSDRCRYIPLSRLLYHVFHYSEAVCSKWALERFFKRYRKGTLKLLSPYVSAHPFCTPSSFLLPNRTWKGDVPVRILSPEGKPVWRFLWYSSWRMREISWNNPQLLLPGYHDVTNHRMATAIWREVICVECSVVK